ncbi:MAG: 2OG-Fe(II) oxygenase [Prochlorococcaceae cyanobacterium]
MPASIEFEFSRLENNAFIRPHTDIRDKLVSGLLYLPQPGWAKSYGGDTVFYRSKPGLQIDNWENKRLDVDLLEPAHVNLFIPNLFVLFLKSSVSHHAVSKISCPAHLARCSLNFNVYARRA